MKNKLTAAMVGFALLLASCGTTETDDALSNGTVEENEWKTLKKVSGREIIAELEQTVQDTPIRDKAALAQKEHEENMDGYSGELSKELAEDLAVSAIEGPAVDEAIRTVYAQEGFHNEGVIFYDSQTSGAAQSGIWIGVKNPDERVNELLKFLQLKVDAGEILAEPIYIFRSLHTQTEQYDLQDKVVIEMEALKEKHGSWGVSVNTKTGVIEISHDFLKPEQQQKLRDKFPAHTIQFEQEGSMVAAPGESSIIWPEQPFTEQPVKEGGFLLSVGDESFFVAGGYEGATNYKFPEAEQLKVGQRVTVEASGGIKESYPAQGTAKFVEVLPDYKPAGARLSESQVVAKAIEEFHKHSEAGFLVIKTLSFDEKKKMWVVETFQEDEKVLIEIED